MAPSRPFLFVYRRTGGGLVSLIPDDQSSDSNAAVLARKYVGVTFALFAKRDDDILLSLRNALLCAFWQFLVDDVIGSFIQLIVRYDFYASRISPKKFECFQFHFPVAGIVMKLACTPNQ